jgi:hypothetical protein
MVDAGEDLVGVFASGERMRIFGGYSSLKERGRVKVVLTWCFRLVVAGPGHA